MLFAFSLVYAKIANRIFRFCCYFCPLWLLYQLITVISVMVWKNPIRDKRSALKTDQIWRFLAILLKLQRFLFVYSRKLAKCRSWLKYYGRWAKNSSGRWRKKKDTSGNKSALQCSSIRFIPYLWKILGMRWRVNLHVHCKTEDVYYLPLTQNLLACDKYKC